MKSIDGIGLSDVQQVYSGAEGDLWELLMGHQIHIGGFQSSMDLAERAGIAPDTKGVDLCCCNGAGMRFLLRFRNVAHMTGVDATVKVLERGRERSAEEGWDEKTTFVEAEVTATGLPDGAFDFVWGEDAWCYVADKPGLVAEAARLARHGGTIAFTDWVEGPAGLSDEEAARFLSFMKFPNVQDLDGYRGLLEANGCTVQSSVDTGRFPDHVDLYLKMVEMQLTSDALRLVGWDLMVLQALGGEMKFLQELAHANKIAQGLFLATKE
jgi:ubiquinone/menaquinone biosynthesis C-methylase UbiE